MRLDWQLEGRYEELGGESVLREAVKDALAVLPREHLRELAAVVVLDHDPKGKALGVWRQDHASVVIELYAEPHGRDLPRLAPGVRDFALRLHLAYTLFHEVGHHVTRYLNRRAAPPRKAARVEQKIERWADEYAEKRLVRLCDLWLRPGGRADSPEKQEALARALSALRLDALVRLPDWDEGEGEAKKETETVGTKPARPAS